jgi:hypothetical protein
MSEFMDKAKKLASEHSEQADQGLDKAAEMAGRLLDGRSHVVGSYHAASGQYACCRERRQDDGKAAEKGNAAHSVSPHAALAPRWA